MHWEGAGNKLAWRLLHSQGLDPGLRETYWQEEQCWVDSGHQETPSQSLFALPARQLELQTVPARLRPCSLACPGSP